MSELYTQKELRTRIHDRKNDLAGLKMAVAVGMSIDEVIKIKEQEISQLEKLFSTQTFKHGARDYDHSGLVTRQNIGA